MWIPRGLIRSAGPLIYAIVNPVKLCHKYRLMPPLRPADVITAEPALHNFRSSSSSVALFPVFLFLASRSRGTCPSFRCIFRVPTAAAAAMRRCGAARHSHNAHPAPFPFSLDSRCAHIRAPEIPNHPFTLPFYLFPPVVVGPTLSRFKSITHS